MGKSNLKFEKISGDILLSFAASFLLLFFAPTMLYINNALDFSFDIYDVWKHMVPVALIVFLTSVSALLLSRVIDVKVHSIVIYFYLSVLLAMLIQGTFLSASIPVLDGNEIDWSKDLSMRIFSGVVWAACFIVFGFVLILGKRKTLLLGSVYIGGIILSFLAVSLGITLFTSKTAFTEKNQTTMTADGAFDMSEDMNFVIFLLDAVDEKEFEKVIYENPEYLDSFDGFTAYTNVMGMYPYTTRAVPYILFGEKYDNTYFYSNYLRRAINHSPFFQELFNRNFDCRVYFEYLYLTEISHSEFKNFVNVENFKNPKKFCKMLIKLTGLQYLPYELKKYCVLTPEDIYLDTLKTVEQQNIDYYSFNNKELYARIESSPIRAINDNCFRFFYAHGAHVPWLYDSQMNEVENGTYDEAIKCSIKLAETYIQKLKDNGLFDQTVIIFLSDHGFNVSDPDSDHGRQNPILLIKGLNENHPLQLSDLPIAHSDLQKAYLRLLNGNSSSELFDWEEGDTRERFHLISNVVIESDIYEYSSIYKASDTQALKPTGIVYPFDWDTIIIED